MAPYSESIAVRVGGTGALEGMKSFSYVSLDPAAMDRILRSSAGPVARAMIERGERVRVRAQQLVGIDTRNLREHIIKRLSIIGRELAVTVGAEVKYAYWHHEGSDAVNGKLMVFTSRKDYTNPRTGEVTPAGTVVFIMSRRAIPPNRFLVNALPAAGD